MGQTNKRMPISGRAPRPPARRLLRRASGVFHQEGRPLPRHNSLLLQSFFPFVPTSTFKFKLTQLSCVTTSTQLHPSFNLDHFNRQYLHKQVSSDMLLIDFSHSICHSSAIIQSIVTKSVHAGHLFMKNAVRFVR